MSDEFLSWARTVLFDAQGVGRDGQILVMTPTEGPPGIFTDERGDDYITVRHSDGKCYAVSWFRNAQELAMFDPEPGSLIFSGAYVKNIDWSFEPSDSVKSELVSVEWIP
jgi:hypothetical protein